MRRSVVAYCRVSSEEQRERETIVNQVSRIKAFALENGLEIAEYYLDDGVTGMKPLGERPAGARLLRDARAGKIEAVWIYSHDRLGRDLRNILNDEYELKTMGVAVNYITQPDLDDTPESELAGNIFAIFAGYDRKKLLRRMNDAKLDKVRAGKWAGGLPSYGYEIGADGFLHIKEDEAEVVRLIYSLAVDENLGEALIVERLNQMGVPNYFAGRGMKKWGRMATDLWNISRVSRILRDPLYCGEYTYGKKGTKFGQIKYEVPPIISPAIFYEARAIIKKRSKGGRKSEIPYLLRGLLSCAKCGRAYCGATTRVNGIVYRYYRCKSDGRDGYGRLHRCGSKAISANWAEEQVWADIERFLTSPEAALMLLDEQNKVDKAKIEQAHRRASEIDALLSTEQEQRSRVLGLYRKGLIDDDTIQQELEHLRTEMRTLQAEKDALFTQIERSDKDHLKREAARSLLKSLSGRLATLTLAHKQEIIGILVEQVLVGWDDDVPYIQPTYCFGPLHTDLNAETISRSK